MMKKDKLLQDISKKTNVKAEDIISLANSIQSKDLKNETKAGTVTIKPIISAIGAAHKTPLIPINFGSIKARGAKHTKSRVRETTIAFTGFPTA